MQKDNSHIKDEKNKNSGLGFVDCLIAGAAIGITSYIGYQVKHIYLVTVIYYPVHTFGNVY